MTWDSIREHVVQSIAAAALLGGGALVFNGTIENAKQDARLERVEKQDARLENIEKNVSETREAVARLEAKMEK